MASAKVDSNGQPVIATCPDCGANYITIPRFSRCEICNGLLTVS